MSAEIPQDKVADYVAECCDALQSQKAVTAYFSSEQLLPFEAVVIPAASHMDILSSSGICCSSVLRSYMEIES